MTARSPGWSTWVLKALRCARPRRGRGASDAAAALRPSCARPPGKPLKPLKDYRQRNAPASQLWRQVDGKHACLVGRGGECSEVLEDSPLPSALAADPLLPALLSTDAVMRRAAAISAGSSGCSWKSSTITNPCSSKLRRRSSKSRLALCPARIDSCGSCLATAAGDAAAAGPTVLRAAPPGADRAARTSCPVADGGGMSSQSCRPLRR